MLDCLKRSFKQNIDIIMVFLFSLVLCLVLFYFVVMPADVYSWDQSHHALFSTMIARDVETGDWDGFWRDTHHQAHWPFFHSWVVAIFFVFFGASYATAGAANLAIYFLILILVYLTGRELSLDRGKLIGALAWFLMVTSNLIVFFGTSNMIEILGAFLTVGAFYCLLKLENTKKWAWIAPLGILTGICIVTKYNYAMFIIASIICWSVYDLISAIIDAQKREPLPISAWAMKYLLVFIPSLLISIWWLFGPESERKWGLIYWNKKYSADGAFPIDGLINNITYYFKVLAINYTWFPLFGIMTVIAIFGIFLLIKKDKNAVLLGIFSWVPLMISIFIIWSKTPRFILPFVPIILLSSAYFWVFLWGQFSSSFGPAKKRQIIFLGTMILVISFIANGKPMLDFYLGKTTPQVEGGRRVQGERMSEVLDFFHKNTPPHSALIFGTSFVELSPYAFYLHLSPLRPGPVVNEFSLGQIKLQSGMYLADIKMLKGSPFIDGKDIKYDPEGHAEGPWNLFIKKNASHLDMVSEKYFPKLGFRVQIFRIK
ncbi:glycosyltransferase family 39 protein [Candidatus Saganbacteria bacterium]|nr:glycosyltransferase family 39 protein [Candidatus Saganbacteria bacterium]